MDPLYAFVKTIIDFLVRIVTLILEMFIFILNFVIGLISSIASAF